MAVLRDWLLRVVNGGDKSASIAPERSDPPLERAHEIENAPVTELVAEPSLGGVRQVISGQPAIGLTPQRLTNILRAAAEGDPEAYFELAEDIEERDLHYAAVMATRKRSVAQLPITVKAASDAPEHRKHAALIQSWVDDGILRSSLFDVLDAIGKGVSVMEVDWQYHSGHLCPRALVYRTPRWFKFSDDDGETVLLRDGASGIPLPPHKFIVHRHKAKSGLTSRAGIARIAAWAWMFKQFTVKDWAMFVQNYGMPIRIGKYGPGATEAEKDVLWRAVTGIAGDCAAIMRDDMLIEFHEAGAKGGTTDMYEKRADWMNREMSKVVLGQTTTTDAVSGGHAVSQEHRLVQEDIERSDALSVTSTFNAQLIPNIIAFNFGPQDRYPQILIGRPDEVPLDLFAEAFDKLAQHGLTAEESFVRDRMGIPAPKEGAILIGGRVPTPVPGRVDLPPPADTKQQDKQQSVHQSFNQLFKSFHARDDSEDLADRISARIERQADGAMNSLLEEVRVALNQATDLRDAAERLSKLNLDGDQLAEAMAQGMALAHLAGQASLVDGLKDRA